MTVIAYKAGVLAGDSLRDIRGMRTYAEKVYLAGDYIYGAAGDSMECDAFKRWVLDGQAAPQPPLRNIDLIRIDRHGRIEIADQRLLWMPLPVDFVAFGTGGDVALGAMAAGASAEQAVRIAIELEKSCGGAVRAIDIGELGDP